MNVKRSKPCALAAHSQEKWAASAPVRRRKPNGCCWFNMEGSYILKTMDGDTRPHSVAILFENRTGAISARDHGHNTANGVMSRNPSTSSKETTRASVFLMFTRICRQRGQGGDAGNAR